MTARRRVARMIIWTIALVWVFGQLYSIYGWGGWAHVVSALAFGGVSVWALFESGYLDWSDDGDPKP